jgi:hypothetical protein
MTRVILLSLAAAAMLAMLAGSAANGQQGGPLAGAKASKGSPRVKPHQPKGVINELVESPVTNLNYGHADSVGFFQMRQGVLHPTGPASKQFLRPSAPSPVVSPRIAALSTRAR